MLPAASNRNKAITPPRRPAGSFGGAGSMGDRTKTYPAFLIPAAAPAASWLRQQRNFGITSPFSQRRYQARSFSQRAFGEPQRRCEARGCTSAAEEK